MDWLDEAPCRGKHHDLWYPPLDAPSPSDYYAVGKLVCHSCPVWRRCATYGTNEVWGMWGGLTPQERKGTAKIVHGTTESYRRGCDCGQCDRPTKPTPVDLTKIPNQGSTFDIKVLLFDLIG